MKPQMSRGEFIALMAMLTAMTAFAIDAILPAMTEIGLVLSPGNPNNATLLLTAFVFGMGIGLLFAGPLADSFGRRPVVLGGVAFYSLGALLGWWLQSLEGVIFARLLMGIGAAAPRVVVIAIVRDRFAGPDMAKLMSFVMMVFMVVPAIAPSVGALIMGQWGWRAIFPAFLIFGIVSLIWFMLRQPETLKPEDRMPLAPAALGRAVVSVLSIPLVRRSIMVQTLGLGALFGTLTSVELVFSETYGRGPEFPLWFALIAVCSALGALLNTRLVTRMGMMSIVRGMLMVVIAATALFLVTLFADLPKDVEFALWIIWVCIIFVQGALVLGNVNAVAMQPLGHMAGVGASVIAALSTIFSAVLAGPIGAMFDGTPRPLVGASLIFVIVALVIASSIKNADLSDEAQGVAAH